MSRLFTLSCGIVFCSLAQGGWAAGPKTAGCVSEYLESALQENRFETGRGFDEYRNLIGKEFKLESYLTEFGSDSVWIDAGAGQARAMRQVFSSKRRPQSGKGIAIAISKPSQIRLPAAVEYISDFWLDQANHTELQKAGLVQSANLITDLGGPTQYTMHLDQLLSNYHKILRPDGLLAITCIDLNVGLPVPVLMKNPERAQMNTFMINGRSVKPREFFEAIPGFVVEDFGRKSVNINDEGFTVVLKKIVGPGKPVQIETHLVAEGVPPYRRFNLLVSE